MIAFAFLAAFRASSVRGLLCASMEHCKSWSVEFPDAFEAVEAYAAEEMFLEIEPHICIPLYNFENLFLD
jgi:hypothetical protein